MMKYFATAATAALLAGAASAAEPEATLAIGLDADVEQICGIASTSAAVLAVDFGQLAQTDVGTELSQDPAGSQEVVCNDPDGMTVTVSSGNGGFLFANGGGVNNQIAYQLEVQGEIRSNKGPMVDDREASLPGSQDLLEGMGGNTIFYVNGVGTTTAAGSRTTTVFAGDYTDTVTYTVTAR
jgi:spore coat protein U-like protein